MKNIYSSVFRWLAIGLAISFLVGFVLALNIEALYPIFITSWIIGAIAQLGIALLFGLLLKKISYNACKILYILYCVLTGINISVILLVYEVSSVIGVFIATAAILGILAFMSDKMNVDIRKLGIILLVSLLAIIIVSIINIFLGSTQLELLLSVAGIVVFMGYIVYDLKVVEPLAIKYGEDKAAIYSAFQIYLDFINLFIRLLQLFGKRRD